MIQLSSGFGVLINGAEEAFFRGDELSGILGIMFHTCNVDSSYWTYFMYNYIMYINVFSRMNFIYNEIILSIFTSYQMSCQS